VRAIWLCGLIVLGSLLMVAAQEQEAATGEVAEVTEVATDDESTETDEIKIAENLVLNPSFEEDLGDWQAPAEGEGIEVARDDRCASDGEHSLRLTSKSGKDVTCVVYTGPVEPCRRYRFTTKYAASTMDTDAEVPPAPLIWIEFDAKGQSIAPAVNVVGSHQAVEWETLEHEVTTPPDVEFATVTLYIWRQKGTAWFDEMEFGPLVQGEMPVVTCADNNLLFNGDMEAGCKGQPGGWLPGSQRMGIYQQWVKYDKQGCHIWADAGAHSGKHCLACEVKDRSKVPYIFWGQNVMLKPDTTYRVSGWMRTEGKSSIKLQCTIYGSRGLEEERPATGYIGRGPWKLKQVVFRTPEGDGLPRSGLVGVVGGGVGKMFADDIRLEEVGAELKDVKVEVTSDKQGNVFMSMDDVKLTVRLTNETEKDLWLSAFYMLRSLDSENGGPKAFMAPQRVSAGESVEAPLEKILEEAGIYKLAIRVVAAGGGHITSEFPLAAAQ